MSDLQHLLPPVYFDGIRLSGTLYESDEYGGVYFPVSLNIEGDYESTESYNSSVWNSDINRVASLPFFASSGFDKYQYCLSPYSSSFPANDSSRDPVVLEYSEKRSNYTQAAFENDWFTDGDRDSDNIIYENTPHPRWINRNFPSGRDILTTSQMTKVYSMGFNPFSYECPILVPLTKCPLISSYSYNDQFYENNGYSNKFLEQFPPKNSEQSVYQLYFLVDNTCKDIEVDVNIINEHSLIKWNFGFGVIINNKHSSSFSIISKESEDLFVYDPLTGSVPYPYALASGHCPQRAKTKYKIKIKDIPSREGPSLVQIYLDNINYSMPNSGEYVPEELYEKFTDIFTQPKEISNKEYTAGKELFYEEFFKTPIAHHKQPWYENCKNEWNAANGRFNQPESDIADIGEELGPLASAFIPSSEYFYQYVHESKNYPNYFMGNSKKLESHNEIVSGPITYVYTYQNFAINFGGFGTTVYDYKGFMSSEIKHIDLAPVAVEFEKITPIRRKKLISHLLKLNQLQILILSLLGLLIRLNREII